MAKTMNIFSRKGQSSTSHISILVDNAVSIAPFRPGSRIAGTATLQSTFQRPLHRAEVIFFGHTVTHCSRTESMGTNYFRTTNFSTNETIKYFDDACLFRLTQPLCQELSVEPNRPYTWRFDFTFPHVASLVGPSPYQGPTVNSGNYTSERHLLPPSFERYFNSNHYARIEYTVQCVFQFSDAQEPLTRGLPPLDFLPVPRSPEPSTFVEYVKPPEGFNISQQGEKKEKFRLSFRDRSSLTSSSFNLVMKASLNREVVRSATFPIYVCVEIDHGSEGAVSMQSISMRIKSLAICPITLFRARQYSGWSSMEEFQEINEDTVPLNALPDRIVSGPPANSSGSSTVFTATFESRIPEAVPPSFRTFNINHSSQLKVTLEAEVLGKTFEHKFVVERFTILPSA